jgi:transcriptional regulator with XRE-family HTH domain
VAQVGIASSLIASRARLGWSREALAYHSGVSAAAIAQIESGRRKDVRLSSLSMLADALGVTTDYLVRGAAAEPRPLLDHRVLLYGSDEEFLLAAVPYLLEGIERGEFVFVATTRANIVLLRDALGGNADSVEFGDASEWYRSPLQALAAFAEVREERCKAGAPWVRILGEPAWAGWSRSQQKAWIRCEAAVNLTLTSAPVTILCAYDTRSIPGRVIGDARRTHPTLQSRGDLEPSPDFCDPAEMLVGTA